MQATAMKNTTTEMAVSLDKRAANIRNYLQQAKEAAEKAATPYFILAGEELLAVKGELSPGEFTGWVERNFDFTDRTARRYMALAVEIKGLPERTRVSAQTQADVLRAIGQPPQEEGARARDRAIRPILEKIDTNTLSLRRDELKRREEREAERQLALQLIDIGYKILAQKLHPDKPDGSREAMRRLNAVRDRLKSCT